MNKENRALNFYKFINDNNIEYHFVYNDEKRQDDVIFFPYYWQIDNLRKILSVNDFDDSGIECIMKDGYFAFYASDFLEDYGIELEEIFDKNIDD